MPHRIRLAFAMLNLSLFVLAALPIVRELTRRDDIWWTPRTMLVPLEASGDRVEIYAQTQPLETLLRSGQVQRVDAGRSTPLMPEDIGFRFNNTDRVRAGRLPMLLLSAAVCGATACLFLVMVTGALVYREERKT